MIRVSETRKSFFSRSHNFSARNNNVIQSFDEKRKSLSGKFAKFRKRANGKRQFLILSYTMRRRTHHFEHNTF